jgi:hypothetical protein
MNQTCSPCRDLSNDVSHSQFWGREDVDSRLLVVGSQTANLTPGPSFAHNLGYRCPNDQCEAIFYIYAPRPFQWHQEHLNARCFGPCCRAMNTRESWRTPNPHFFQVLGFTPTLGQSRVGTPPLKNPNHRIKAPTVLATFGRSAWQPLPGRIDEVAWPGNDGSHNNEDVHRLPQSHNSPLTPTQGAAKAAKAPNSTHFIQVPPLTSPPPHA